MKRMGECLVAMSRRSMAKGGESENGVLCALSLSRSKKESAGVYVDSTLSNI